MLTILLLIQLPRLRFTDNNRDEEINLLRVFSAVSLIRTRKHAIDMRILNFENAFTW